MAQVPGLDERSDLDGLVLEVDQIPLTAWVFPVVLAMFGTFFVGMMLQPMLLFGVGLFFLSFAVIFAADRYRPGLTVQIGLNHIALEGWFGYLARPGTERLPVVGTHVRWSQGAQINGVQVWVLKLTNGDRTVVIPSLRCTEAELRAIRDRVEGMEALALAAHGDGEAEVPPELRQVVERQRPLSE